MSSPPFESRNVTDDRIASQNSPRNRRSGAGAVKYETTLSGDVVVVEPSFDIDDDGGEHCDDKMTSTSPSPNKGEWQARSPSGDEKSPRPEERSSPSKEERSHGRNLSAHFFDATKLSEAPRDAGREVDYYRDLKPRPEEGEVYVSGQKHHRGSDSSDPPVAHRRINSVGRSKVVEKGYGRGYPEQQRRHHREDSAGLDILSAAADCTEEELAAVTDPRRRPTRAPWEPPSGAGHRNSPNAANSEHYYGNNGSMLGPPPPPPMSRSYPPQSHAYMQPNSYPPHPYHPSSFYPPPHPYHRGIPHNQSMGYPVQYSHRMDPYAKHHHMPPHMQHSMGPPPMGEEPGRQPSPSGAAGDDRMDSDERLQGTRTPVPPVPSSQWRTGTTQGVQTFVTAIGVGDGNKMMQPSNMQKGAGTGNENMYAPPHNVPSMVGQASHHRKMSSYSSLGTIIGSAMFAEPNNDHPLKKQQSNHHRRASSSASFLHGFDVGLEGSDVAFLHNLQASHNTDASVVPFCMPVPPPECPPSPDAKSDSQKSDSKFVLGGTSKRVRRKCTMKDCPNRVVQGGLCIAHGARRKTCKHPGCNKNVKKAGLCSTHGPARKRCDADGCSKVAVQGGKCIAHGAKKKLCSHEDCNKQAILAGMCKKHHDQSLGIASNRFGVPVKTDDSTGEDMETTASSSRQHSSRHQRGLSIFQEISADTVQDLLSHDGPTVSTVGENNRDSGTSQRPYNTVFL